jgi:hypothetical protein
MSAESDEINGIATLICECCWDWFKDPYVNTRFCPLCCGPYSDCMPGRCSLPDELAPDPVARWLP